MPALGAPPSQNIDVFTNPEALKPHHSVFLMKVSLHRHDRLNHWPLVIELNLQLASSPWGWLQAGVGLKVLTL